jgi:hypothetical protein
VCRKDLGHGSNTDEISTVRVIAGDRSKHLSLAAGVDVLMTGAILFWGTAQIDGN